MICTMIWYEKRERAGWDTCVNIRVGCELLRMRPLRSSDRRRVSLVCRNSLKSVATKPNLRRKRFPSVSVKNFISPSAFGLWWNNYFHPDLWVALQKILQFFATYCDPRSHEQKDPILVSGRMGTSVQQMYFGSDRTLSYQVLNCSTMILEMHCFKTVSSDAIAACIFIVKHL